MAFYTPHNLKVRLDEEKLSSVIIPLKVSGEYDDILLDIELWEKLPDAMSTFVAITTAFLINSWIYTIVFAFIAFFVGLLMQELFYSDTLKNIFPMFLGGWLIALPLTIIVCFVLINDGLWINAIVLGFLFIANWLNLNSFLVLLWTPISIYFIKKTGLGSIERAFISICNRKASKMGIVLNWDLYNDLDRLN